jgi:DNA-binding phage protein
MTQISREAGLGRESLYKALSSSGNPERGTVSKVMSVLELQLHASPAAKAETTFKQCHSPEPAST